MLSRDIVVVCFITVREKLFLCWDLLLEVCCTATWPISQEADICLLFARMCRGNVSCSRKHKHIVGHNLLRVDYCVTKGLSFNNGKQFLARICCRSPAELAELPTLRKQEQVSFGLGFAGRGLLCGQIPYLR